MKKKVRNIIELTKILFKDSFQISYILDKKTNKINKKSPFVWLFIILTISISYITYLLLDMLNDVGQEEIFLNLFPLILMIFMFFQVVLASTNIYYFSKDFEWILPLPIKSEELLIAKFNTLILNLYFLEVIFVFFPLIIYGIMTCANFVYYMFLILFLLIFPFFPALLVSIIIMLLMKLSKFIKNKNVFQITITLIFIIFVFILELLLSQKIINSNFGQNEQETIQIINNFYEMIENINKYFIVINPSIKMLKYSNFKSIIQLIKIIVINLIGFKVFILIGRKTYLNDILKNNNVYIKKNKENINYRKMCKKNNKMISYIKKELKSLFYTPAYFIQCIFPVLILLISIVIIILTVLPNIRNFLNSQIIQDEYNFKVDISVICIIISIIQVVFTSSNISITSVSREGKNAKIMKYLPIGLYKQFLYKSIPQILINFSVIIFILIFVRLLIHSISYLQLLIILLISLLLNILNSELMVIIDFIKPNLNWNSEYEAIKKNENKLFQYVLSIFIFLLLNYFTKVLNKVNLYISEVIIISFFMILIFIINLIIKKCITKIFNKIY